MWHADPEERVTITRPAHRQLREAFEGYPRVYGPERGFVCELKRCQLAGRNAVGVSRRMKLIEETAGCRLGQSFVGPYTDLIKHAASSYRGALPERAEKYLFPLVSPDPSYYHWMMEYLPKLRLLELYQTQTGTEPTILLEANPSQFVYQTLRQAGYDASRCVEWDRTDATVQHLVVATHRPHVFDYDHPVLSDYNPSRADLRWLRDRMLSSVSQWDTDTDDVERIYISRQNAKRGRRVVNYQETVEVLERYDVRPFVLENHSFEEQLRLLGNSEVIIGPHGAGLLNAMFAQNPTLIELFPDTVLKPHFYFLSELLDFEYSALVTESDGTNLIVDTSELDALLRETLDGS